MLRQSLYWRSVAGANSPRDVPHGRPTEARLLVRRWEGAGRRWRSRLGDRVYFNGTGRPPRSRGTAPTSRCQSDYRSQADTPLLRKACTSRTLTVNAMGPPSVDLVSARPRHVVQRLRVAELRPVEAVEGHECEAEPRHDEPARHIPFVGYRTHQFRQHGAAHDCHHDEGRCFFRPRAQAENP